MISIHLNVSLKISRRKRPFVSNYHFGPIQLIRVVCQVDLGVTVSYNLSWNKHIALIVAKTNKMLGLLRKTCPMLVNRDARRTILIARKIPGIFLRLKSGHRLNPTISSSWKEFKYEQQEGSSK